MNCPFCNHDILLTKLNSKVDEEYILNCPNCHATGAIFRRKHQNAT